MSDKLALILDEAICLVESCLHSLLNNLAKQYQILCGCRDMQYILDVALEVVIAYHVLNHLCGVITHFHHPKSLVFPSSS